MLLLMASARVIATVPQVNAADVTNTPRQGAVEDEEM